MGLEVTQYTKPEYVGYVVRMKSGLLAVCRSLETARKLNTTGIVRICMADHYSPTSNRAVVFTPQDQSWGALHGAINSVEMSDEGDDVEQPGAVVDYVE